jgi:hypothetical protein
MELVDAMAAKTDSSGATADQAVNALVLSNDLFIAVHLRVSVWRRFNYGLKGYRDELR